MSAKGERCRIALMTARLFSKSTLFLLGSGLVVPLLLVGVPAAMAYRAESKVKSSFSWVTHTLEVETSIESLVNSMVSAETGQRGFLLTRRVVYLEPYDAGVSQVERQMHDLRKLTADNDYQQQRLRDLDPLITERLGILADTIASERKSDHEGALALVNSDRGKYVMDKIRGVLRLMGAEEERLLRVRQQELGKQATHSKRVLWLLVAVSAVLAAGWLWLLYRLSRVEPMIEMCAYSRTVEYNGEWLSFEAYLQRRFGIETSHGLSPAEFEKLRMSKAA